MWRVCAKRRGPCAEAVGSSGDKLRVWEAISGVTRGKVIPGLCGKSCRMPVVTLERDTPVGVDKRCGLVAVVIGGPSSAGPRRAGPCNANGPHPQVGYGPFLAP